MLLAMLGASEIAIILVIILIMFGPSKLPQLGAGVGKMLRGFKKEIKELENEKAESEKEAPHEIDVTPVERPVESDRTK